MRVRSAYPFGPVWSPRSGRRARGTAAALGGPLESLRDALSCECFFVSPLEPELHSDLLPEEELLEIGRGVLDCENGGSV